MCRSHRPTGCPRALGSPLAAKLSGGGSGYVQATLFTLPIHHKNFVSLFACKHTGCFSALPDLWNIKSHDEHGTSLCTLKVLLGVTPSAGTVVRWWAAVLQREDMNNPTSCGFCDLFNTNTPKRWENKGVNWSCYNLWSGLMVHFEGFLMESFNLFCPLTPPGLASWECAVGMLELINSNINCFKKYKWWRHRWKPQFKRFSTLASATFPLIFRLFANVCWTLWSTLPRNRTTSSTNLSSTKVVFFNWY